MRWCFLRSELDKESTDLVAKVIHYCVHKSYPAGATKNEKRVIRHKAGYFCRNSVDSRNVINTGKLKCHMTSALAFVRARYVHAFQWSVEHVQHLEQDI